MELLRLILLLAGIVLIAGVYIQGRRSQRPRESWRDDGEDESVAEVAEPLFLTKETDGDDIWNGGPLKAERDDPPASDQLDALSGLRPATDDDIVMDDPPAPAAPEETIIAITILAPSGHYLEGQAVSEAIDAAGLDYGELNIFHRYADGIPGKPVYSLANVIEPGTFDLASLHEIITPGLALFMRLPGPVDGADAFQDMLLASRTLADRLQAIVSNEKRQPLTQQDIEKLELRAHPYKASGRTSTQSEIREARES